MLHAMFQDHSIGYTISSPSDYINDFLFCIYEFGINLASLCDMSVRPGPFLLLS